MGPEGREPNEESDDLFEDLDTFFSTMDEDDWPEAIEGEPEPGDASPGEPGEPALGPAASPTSGGGTPPPARGERGTGGSRAEMDPADWSRLRDVLGEDESDEDEDEFPVTEPPGLAAEDSLFGYAGPDEESEEAAGAMSGRWETGGGGPGRPHEGGPEDRPELTLDDLKKAPPEYRDLPAPPEEPSGPPERMPTGSEPLSGPRAAGGSSGDQDDDEWVTGSRRQSEPFETDTPPESQPFGTGPHPESGAFEPGPPPGTEEQPPMEPEEPAEPTLADVQAAADRLAGEFGAEPSDANTPGGVDDDLLADLTEPKGPRTVKVGDPEAMLGPAWEDPTARILEREPSRLPRLGGGRNLPMAVLTGVALGLVAIITLLIASAAFAVVAGAVILVAQAELYATMQRRGFQPATALGLVLGGMTLAGAYTRGEQGMLFMLVLSVVLSFLWYMVAPAKARSGAVANIAATLFGLVYVPFFGGYAILVLTQANYGRWLLVALIGLTFIYDIVAFAAGSIWGSRPLAPTISPKKSWEGLLVASVATFLVSLPSLTAINPMSPIKAIGFALVVIVFAPLGDLAESAIKRDLGVKDMGTIMPGHGGALDRIDSVLFVAPAIFYFLRLIF